MLDMHGEMLELTGEGLPLPRSWEAFPVPADVVTALHCEVMPLQVLEWLGRTKPELFSEGAVNGQLREIAPFVERAKAYGITRKTDMATFVAFGLRYKTNYDAHPAVQQALTAPSSAPLIDAFGSLKSEVWQELADTAQLREGERAVQQWRDAAIATGHLVMKVRFVNVVDRPVFNIRIESPAGPDGQWQRIARQIEPASFRSAVLESPSVTVPVPGRSMTLAWGGPFGWWTREEIVIEGELPRNGDSGVLVVNFLNYEATARMYAEEPTGIGIGDGH
jgi:hypothetical protein